MASIFKKFAPKIVIGTALAATALASATPAMADDYRGNRRHDDGAGTAIAVGLGILGIAAVAAIASSHNRDRCDGDRNDDRRCYERGYNGGGYNNGGYYYNNGGYNNNGYNGGGYYDQNRNWHRHDRDRDDRRGYQGRGYDGNGYYDRSNENHGYRGF